MSRTRCTASPAFPAPLDQRLHRLSANGEGIEPWRHQRGELLAPCTGQSLRRVGRQNLEVEPLAEPGQGIAGAEAWMLASWTGFDPGELLESTNPVV